jgi:hypothetical protein
MELAQVFGVSSSQVASYVARSDVDNAFASALDQRRHIVVYGASKQGKTALVSRHISYQDNVVIRLEPASALEDIYLAILRYADVSIEKVRKESSSSGSDATVGVEAKATIFGFGGGGVRAEGGLHAERTLETESEVIPFNLSLAQDVVELLRRVKFDKKVILENFHYVSEEEQRRLAFALRSLEEMGLIFVIVGVWRERDKLRNYCGDLTDRLIEIPVEPWNDADFYRVAREGAKVLNVELAPAVVAECVQSSFGSIGVFQELMKETFSSASVLRRQDEVQVIGDASYAKAAIQVKSGQYRTVHAKSLTLVAAGHVSQHQGGGRQPLFLPYYLVRAIVRSGRAFVRGMSRSELTQAIKSEHHRPDDVRSADISNLLNRLGSLQSKKGINPPIIDYDSDARHLFAVDSTFFFFLQNCDLNSFLEEMVCPLEVAEDMDG